MVGGNLTLEEWKKLSNDERGERYKDLSDHDKFIVRMSMVYTKPVLCNRCLYYNGFAKCAAFPDGIPKGHFDKVNDNVNTICSGKFKFCEKSE